MSASPVHLYNRTEDDIPIDRNTAHFLLRDIEEHEECAFDFIEVVFVDEEKITEVNRKFLGKDYVTDIISFRYDEDESRQAIEGTLYCCAPRIAEQAEELKEQPSTEFRRVFIHGLLHLAGYEDQTADQKSAMREREDFYLRESGS